VLDRVDYTAYVTARAPRLRRTAYLVCRDWALAEDLLQTALTKAWRVWDRIEDDPDPYVYRILVNTHASWMRRRWHGEISTSSPPDSADSRDAVEAVDRRDQLWPALGRLPRRQRAVLVLRYYEDLTEPQVAAVLGCSVGTVKSQASKALAKLRIDPSITSPAAGGAR
jgi:RNA polymerase sigma-70 factor (sigma-E family)